jgi:ferritin-like metal-binding protein YciE
MSNQDFHDVPGPSTPLLQQLYQLYTAERQLSLDLFSLFHQSTSIPLRLELSDRRRETTRHIIRLEQIIQMTTGTPVSRVAASMTTLRALVVEPDDRDVTLDLPLQALEIAIAAYGAAISTATRLGHASIADLLAESLSEKGDLMTALSGRQTSLTESLPAPHPIQR